MLEPASEIKDAPPAVENRGEEEVEGSEESAVAAVGQSEDAGEDAIVELRRSKTVAAAEPAVQVNASEHAEETVAEAIESIQLRQTKSNLFGPAEGVRVLELVRNGENALARLTPRAVEACTREGIALDELLPQPLDFFQGGGRRERHTLKRHERHVEARLSKLDLVCATRMLLVEEGWPPTEAQQVAAAADSATVAEWRRRSERQADALNRRGERSEERREQREALEEAAAARGEETERRKQLLEEARQAQSNELATKELTRRTERETRVLANQASTYICIII